jgi:hypothetical protein
VAQSKPDAKYFRNGLLLIGVHRALHFFTADPGSRQEIVTTMEKVVRELQEKAVVRRQQKALGTEGSGKLSFVIGMGSPELLMPEFRVEVIQT